jgi:hypothetical protein
MAFQEIGSSVSALGSQELFNEYRDQLWDHLSSMDSLVFPRVGPTSISITAILEYLYAGTEPVLSYIFPTPPPGVGVNEMLPFSLPWYCNRLHWHVSNQPTMDLQIWSVGTVLNAKIDNPGGRKNALEVHQRPTTPQEQHLPRIQCELQGREPWSARCLWTVTSETWRRTIVTTYNWAKCDEPKYHGWPPGNMKFGVPATHTINCKMQVWAGKLSRK